MWLRSRVLDKIIDADHIVRGDGISWMRRYLGRGRERADPPSAHRFRIWRSHHGPADSRTPGQAAATIIPSVGCPMGCNFCTTSAFFGGKGKFLNFYETGEELFDTCARWNRSMNVRSFFIMDENFLLYKKRAMELLDRMKATGKAWALYVFSSANAIRKYTMQGTGGTGDLVDLDGARIAAIDLCEAAGYRHPGADPRTARQRHQAAGLDDRRAGAPHAGQHPREIEHAVSHETDFHQFMLYTPVPGTPLYQEMQEQDRMLSGVDLADIHGQDKFNFQHAAISREQSKQFLDFAFRRDFERNGPSLFRVWRTTLAGWKRYKNHPDPRVRERFEWEARTLKNAASGLLWAMERQLRKTNAVVSGQVRALRQELGREFGPVSRIAAALGPAILWASRREAAAPRRGRDLRTGYGGRTAELVGGLGAGLRRGGRTGPLRQEWDPSTDP